MREHHGLLVETIVNGPIVENCFLVAEAASRQALLIDPGDEETRILETVRQHDLTVCAIVCTHAHIDHVGAVGPLQRLLGAPFYLHPAEAPWLAHLPAQAAAFGLEAKDIPQVDRELSPGQPLTLGALQAEVLYTPGHSAGGCSILFREQRVVFVGDTLFAGSIGRSDLPGGSSQTLLQSIREQLLSLDDDVVVYSGHGPATDIGSERRQNPFLQPGAAIF